MVTHPLCLPIKAEARACVFFARIESVLFHVIAVTAIRDVTGGPGGYGRTDVLGGFDTEEDARAFFNSLEATGRTHEVCITVGGRKIASKRKGGGDVL